MSEPSSRKARLEAARVQHAEALAVGSGASFLATLGEEDPVLLMEICLGPRAPGGRAAVEAALSVRDTLGAHMSDKALFGRLLELGGPEAAELVLGEALSAHPVAPWVARLVAERCEEPAAVVARVAHLDSFGATCAALLEAGAEEALRAHALATGAWMPAAVAWQAGREPLGLRLAAAALSSDESDLDEVFAQLAAAWGPYVGELALGVLPHLGRAAVVTGLAELLPEGSAAARRLQLVGRGLRR